MRFSILTLFPEYFDSALASSLLGRAQANGLISISRVPLRDFGEGKYRAVDDKPYGGGAGMVMMPSVLERAFLRVLGDETRLIELEASVARFRASGETHTSVAPESAAAEGASPLPHVIFLSPQGKRLDAAMARRLAGYSEVALVCGHYEGIDERALEAFVHEEVSIGDFILTGGEPAALVLIDAIARFVPGVVKEQASVNGDTFERGHPEVTPGGLKAALYTRPAAWRGREVPSVLLSGNHAAIAAWRLAESQARTAARRPDLISAGEALKPRSKPKPSRKSKTSPKTRLRAPSKTGSKTRRRSSPKPRKRSKN